MEVKSSGAMVGALDVAAAWSPAAFINTLPSNVSRKGTLRHLRGNFIYVNYFYVLFCFAKKERKKGAPKTMTAVFGWFFGELLCIEVKGSGAAVGAIDLAAT